MYHPEPAQLFYSYANKDEDHCNRLEMHLGPLQQQELLLTWQKCQIIPGSEPAQEINEHFASATIILLLISPDFLDSNDCNTEVQQAMERHERGEASVIPVLLHPCAWQDTSFSKLQVLPRNHIPIMTWKNPDEAFLEVEQCLRDLIKHSSALPSPSRKRGSPTQNREKMLLRLKTMYKELQANSLQEVPWIDLELKQQPEAIHNAANLQVGYDMHAYTFPPGTSIFQVYQDNDQELLLLGEPGAGKSTLLYQLGRDLLQEAVQHPGHPFPVLLSLSSWAEKRLPLQEWMVEQLGSDLYNIPQQQSNQWFQDQQILPLLDGLDEMEETAQSACIVAINAYRRAVGPVCPLVVCCRCSDYRIASTQERLYLQRAIEIQPLSPVQLEAVLSQADEPFASLRTELKENPQLQELARTPLWLTMLLLTIKNTSGEPMPQQSSKIREHLFRLYVDRMVAQKEDKKRRYPIEQTTHWLSWLAKQMHQQNQTVFSVEHLQPNWLPKQHWFKYRWSVMLLIGLFVGLLGGLPVGLLGGLLVGLLGGLFVRLLFGLTFGLAFGPLFGLLVWPLGELFRWQFFEPLIRKELQIILVEHITWSWKKARSGLLVGLFGGLLIGPLGGLMVGLLVESLFSLLGKPLFILLGRPLFSSLYEMLFRQPGGLLGGPLYGLLYGLLGGLLYGLLGGLTLSQSLERHTLSPNEGIRRSLRNGLLIGLLYGLLGGLLGGPLFGLLAGLPIGQFEELLSGLLGGILYGLLGGLLGGLLAVVQHLSLRFWLRRTGCFPFQVGTFLEDARARDLLQRTGGSYRFIHPLLQDYFANLQEGTHLQSLHRQ